jgi:hypothetical protein
MPPERKQKSFGCVVSTWAVCGVATRCILVLVILAVLAMARAVISLLACLAIY